MQGLELVAQRLVDLGGLPAELVLLLADLPLGDVEIAILLVDEIEFLVQQVEPFSSRCFARVRVGITSNSASMSWRRRRASSSASRSAAQ